MKNTNLYPKDGYFGKYGGTVLPPHLVTEMKKISDSYLKIRNDKTFLDKLKYIRKHYQGRPTPISYAKNLSKEFDFADIYLKREDLNHTGAHKLNHCMGQVLLAKMMGKKKIIAETGAGQHGVALATASAYFGLECEIHMGEIDIKKEAPNVIRMKLLGAKVVPVSFGTKTLKDAVDSAFKVYAENPNDVFFAIGSVVGPSPYPLMIKDLQKIIGDEAEKQFKEMTGETQIMLLLVLVVALTLLEFFKVF